MSHSSSSSIPSNGIHGLTFSEVVSERINSRYYRNKERYIEGGKHYYANSHTSCCVTPRPVDSKSVKHVPFSDTFSRGLLSVFSGVERGKLRVSEKAAINHFIYNTLDFDKRSSVGSFKGNCKGKRFEWLFADRSYSYGKNSERHIEPCGAFSEVEHLCAGVVRDLQLAQPNACLLVYYPRGTSGLNFHKDDEPVHASEQVITLCHGVGAALVLKNNSKQEVAREWLRGGDFYVFRNQRSFYHGVDGVDSTYAGRWAFTFRVFKPSSESDESILLNRPLVSDSVAIAKTFPVSAAGENAREEVISEAACDLIARPVSDACLSVAIAKTFPVSAAGENAREGVISEAACDLIARPVSDACVSVRSSVRSACSVTELPSTVASCVKLELLGGGRPRKKVKYNFTNSKEDSVDNVNFGIRDNEINQQNEFTVIMGSIDQGHELFSDTRGKQCTSCVTVTYFYKKDIDPSNLYDIDSVVHTGDQLYRTSKNAAIQDKNASSQNLTFDEVFNS